jgi:hypothetical protein
MVYGPDEHLEGTSSGPDSPTTISATNSEIFGEAIPDTADLAKWVKFPAP